MRLEMVIEMGKRCEWSPQVSFQTAYLKRNLNLDQLFSIPISVPMSISSVTISATGCRRCTGMYRSYGRYKARA